MVLDELLPTPKTVNTQVVSSTIPKREKTFLQSDVVVFSPETAYSYHYELQKDAAPKKK